MRSALPFHGCVLAALVAGQALAASPQAPASTVYRCTSQQGVTVFSDRPCEPAATPYEPDTSWVSTYSPPPVSRSVTTVAPPRAPAVRRRGGGDDQARHAATCERLRNSLKEVAARMRAGYSAKQGEQLRERKARLEQQRRAQRCR